MDQVPSKKTMITVIIGKTISQKKSSAVAKKSSKCTTTKSGETIDDEYDKPQNGCLI